MMYIVWYFIVGIVLGSIYLGAVSVKIDEDKRLEHIGNFWYFLILWPVILIAAITIRVMRGKENN